MADLFKKGKSLFSTTSNSFGSGSGETITLASASGLPVDTEITLTFDREVAGKLERIIGTVSGTNFAIRLRGADSTTDQSHTSPTVEYIWNAKDLNDIVDGILVGHTQEGAHSNALVTTLKATGAVVNTGTSDVTIVTPKAIADSYLGGATSNLQTQISALPTPTSTTTFTNKRITKRILSATSYTTDTGTSLNCDTTDMFIVTAQAGALKFNNPTGTPTDGQTLILAVSSSTTAARALTYDTQFEASTVALPTTTAATTARLSMGFIWRADTSRWTCVAVA
jgi:hypothetical protein